MGRVVELDIDADFDRAWLRVAMEDNVDKLDTRMSATLICNGDRFSIVLLLATHGATNSRRMKCLSCREASDMLSIDSTEEKSSTKAIERGEKGAVEERQEWKEEGESISSKIGTRQHPIDGKRANDLNVMIRMPRTAHDLKVVEPKCLCRWLAIVEEQHDDSVEKEDWGGDNTRRLLVGIPKESWDKNCVLSKKLAEDELNWHPVANNFKPNREKESSEKADLEL